MRYIRYLKKKRKRLRVTRKLQERVEKGEIRRRERERLRQEKILGIQKKESEKRRLKADLDQLRQQHEEERKSSEAEMAERARIQREKIAKDRYYLRRRRRRLLRYYLKLQRRNVIRSIRSLNIRTFRKRIREFREQREQRRLSFVIFMNSLTLYLLSYLTLYLLHQFSTMLTAYFFDFPTILYYWEIYFNITTADWTPDAIKTIFTAGPAISLLAGIVFIIVYSNLKEYPYRFKIFFLWGFIHSMTFFFGALLVGTLFERGLGHTIGWLFIMDTGKVFYSILSIFILFIAGFILTRPFLFSANAYFTNLTRRNRPLFVHSQVSLPFIAGTAILILLREPRFMHYETFITFTAALVVLPVIATYRNYQDYYFEFEEKRTRFMWLAFLVTAILALGYRFGLSTGLNFG